MKTNRWAVWASVTVLVLGLTYLGFSQGAGFGSLKLEGGDVEARTLRATASSSGLYLNGTAVTLTATQINAAPTQQVARITTLEASDAISLTNWTATTTAINVKATNGQALAAIGIANAAIAATQQVARIAAEEAVGAIATTNWTARMAATEASDAIALTNWTATTSANAAATVVAATQQVARIAAEEAVGAIALTNWTARMAAVELLLSRGTGINAALAGVTNITLTVSNGVISAVSGIP